jgi:hypothetical protein
MFEKKVGASDEIRKGRSGIEAAGRKVGLSLESDSLASRGVDLSSFRRLRSLH